MALRSRLPERNGRRVSLTRPDSKGVAGRNSRREPKKARPPRQKVHVSVPWRGIGRFLATGAAMSALFVFLVSVGIGLLYGYRFLTTSSYFALTTVEIQGNSRLSSREILEVADLEEGANILALSIDAVEETLSLSPWVEEVSVKRVLPGTLVIGVKEKVPAFWLLHEGKLYYADARGRIIAPVESGKFASLPTLEVEPGAEEATAALPDLLKSLAESHLPLNLTSVSWVRLSAARGVEVYVDDRRLKISIGLEEWLPNLNRLGKTLADLGRRGEMPEIREIRAQGANVWVEKATANAAGNAAGV